MIHDWVMLFVGEEEISDLFRQAVRFLAALSHMDYKLLASPWTTHLQEALYTLTRIFDWVGFQTNMKKWWVWHASRF